MSDIRLICLDMDGTLLDDDHATVPPRNVAALRAAAERGAAVTIASGRAWSLLRAVDAQIGVTRYAVLSNGAAVLDVATGEWIYRRPMDPAARRTILTLLLDWGLPFEVYCEGENYIQADRTEQVVGSALSPEFAQVLRSVSHFPEDLNAALEGKAVEKIHIFRVPPERRQELLDVVEDCGPLAVTTSFGENMELTAPGVNKGSAVQALCEKLGLEPDQVMAFGDAGNDLELLAWAGWSFAMANASAEARAAARYLTGTNREGGVGMAVEQYLLNA
ncbi:Cof-type HAD-IIB family hydrolase [Flavonifractor sp. An91]|uniref:Cof-type HAD-IIB family hydrolase n=1 Tax=Flavonifractor sp. An91 TaxID=1965665 RepID=UPI000B3AE51F|nr:HAD family hydrolase [Flavonifractor sp. An91]OUN14092.1 hydrolase Cof [Flavonifractor sp. An91]